MEDWQKLSSAEFIGEISKKNSTYTSTCYYFCSSYEEIRIMEVRVTEACYLFSKRYFHSISLELERIPVIEVRVRKVRLCIYFLLVSKAETI